MRRPLGRAKQSGRARPRVRPPRSLAAATIAADGDPIDSANARDIDDELMDALRLVRTGVGERVRTDASGFVAEHHEHTSTLSGSADGGPPWCVRLCIDSF